MNKTELILSVYEKLSESEKEIMSKKDVENVLRFAKEAITEALAREEKIQIIGFGTFETKARAERVGRNPRTKETVTIPASKVPSFKPGKALKDAVNS